MMNQAEEKEDEMIETGRGYEKEGNDDQGKITRDMRLYW